jgi:regulatory protein
MPAPRQTAVEYGIAVVSARSLPERKVRERIAARFSADETAAAVERLRELRMVDDAAWAERFARDRLERNSKGRHRIRGDLLRRGIDAETADAAIAAIVGADAERESAKRVLATLSRQLAPADDADEAQVARSRGRLFRRMMARGFPSSLVRDLLNVS